MEMSEHEPLKEGEEKAKKNGDKRKENLNKNLKIHDFHFFKFL